MIIWIRQCRFAVSSNVSTKLPLLPSGQKTVRKEGVCRLQLKCDGTWGLTGGEVKGKLANEVGSQYSSHYLGTRCVQHYYR
jgi:hypothetical protein